MEDPQEWTVDVLVEAGQALLALRLLRSFDRHPVPHYHVHAFKRALQKAGIDRGVLYTFFDPTPFARLSARLLGIDLMPLADTARLLRQGMLAETLPAARHPFLELARRTETDAVDIRFAPFVRRLREELESLNNCTLALADEGRELRTGQTRRVFLTVTDDGSLTFTATDPAARFHVSQSDFYDLLARLWMQRRLRPTELSQQEFDRSCLFALFSRLPSLRCEQQEILLP
jgi:HAMP domain-containing protein